VSQIMVSSLEEVRWVLVEKPVLKFKRATTNSSNFVEVVSHRVSTGILGVSRLLLSINPDVNASYRVQIGGLLYIDDSPISAIFNVDLPHLDSKVYVGLNPGDYITISHRSLTGANVTTEVFLELNEVYFDESFLRRVVRKPIICETRTLLEGLEGVV